MQSGHTATDPWPNIQSCLARHPARKKDGTNEAPKKANHLMRPVSRRGL